MTMYLIVTDDEIEWHEDGEYYDWTKDMEAIFKRGGVKATGPQCSEGHVVYKADGFGYAYAGMTDEDAIWMKMNTNLEITDTEPSCGER